MNEARHIQGKHGENLVAEHLTKNGFTVKDRNYHSPYGEIDLVATKDNLFTFVEVKLRNKTYLPLSDIVNNTKQRKIVKTAHHYIATYNIQNALFRFDVALLSSQNNQYALTYIPHAFSPTDEESYL